MSPPPPKAAVHFRSLGCPKNLLDTEVMLGSLAVHGYAIAERLEDADVAVVNTCSFIESAREESIQAVLDVAERKGEGKLRALIVTGCLPQRYGAELARQQPGRDWILTRILWLSGSEPGCNRLGNVDSMRRYIYIHGAPDTEPMGVPRSHGCVRMRNADVVELFDMVDAGMPVELIP